MIAALRGFVLSTVAAAIVASIDFTAVAVIGGADGAKLSDLTAEGFLSQVLFFGGIAATCFAVLGLPLTVALSKLRAERAWTYLAITFLLGFALTLLIPAPSEMYLDPVVYLSMTAVGGLPGAVAGLVWWYSYRKRRVRRAGSAPV